MTVSSSITNAVVVLVIVIVVIGLFLGVAVSGSELMNPSAARANEDWLQEKTRHDRTIHELEERLFQAETQLALAQQQAEHDAELEYLKRKTDLKLKSAEIREQTLTGAGVVAVAVLSVGMAATLGLLGYRWSGMGQQGSHSATTVSKDAWKSRAYRDARIAIARENEAHFRATFAREATAQAQSASSDNGRQEPVPSGMNHPASDDRIA